MESVSVINTRKEPPGGKISFPFSTSTTVVPGSPLRTNAFIPFSGSPYTLEAFKMRTCGCGVGRNAVFDGVTREDSEAFPGGFELNQNWARNGLSDISVTVQTLT